MYIHSNTFGPSGQDPDDSEFGNVLREVVGAPVPNIVYDGVMPVARYLTIGLKKEDRHSIHSNDHGGMEPYANADFIGHFGLSWLHKVTRDVTEHDAELPRLKPAVVTIRGQVVNDLVY